MATKENTAKLLDTPRYRAAEAAYLLGMSDSTVRAWCFGQRYRAGGSGWREFEPVITPADPDRRLLSFVNLCELFTLAAATREFHVPLQRVRDGVEFVKTRLDDPRPLATQTFLTNGIGLFVRHVTGAMDVTRQGQRSFPGQLERDLARVEWERSGLPIRLYPYTQSGRRDRDAPRVVVIDPRIAFGRPVVQSAGVTTEVIGDRFAAGDDPDEMAGDYRVPVADIHEALRYEQRIREERNRPVAQRLAA